MFLLNIYINNRNNYTTVYKKGVLMSCNVCDFSFLNNKCKVISNSDTIVSNLFFKWL